MLYALAIERDKARFSKALKVLQREHGSLDDSLHRAKLFCLKWCGVPRGELDSTAQQVVHWAEKNLNSGGSYVSEEITRMLGQWQRPFTPRFRAALLKRLEDTDWSVRSAAAQALAAGVSDSTVRAALLKRLRISLGTRAPWRRRRLLRE
jgi:HEAT repeat protein